MAGLAIYKPPLLRQKKSAKNAPSSTVMSSKSRVPLPQLWLDPSSHERNVDWVVVFLLPWKTYIYILIYIYTYKLMNIHIIYIYAYPEGAFKIAILVKCKNSFGFSWIVCATRSSSWSLFQGEGISLLPWSFNSLKMPLTQVVTIGTYSQLEKMEPPTISALSSSWCVFVFKIYFGTVQMQTNSWIHLSVFFF